MLARDLGEGEDFHRKAHVGAQIVASPSSKRTLPLPTPGFELKCLPNLLRTPFHEKTPRPASHKIPARG